MKSHNENPQLLSSIGIAEPQLWLYLVVQKAMPFPNVCRVGFLSLQQGPLNIKKACLSVAFIFATTFVVWTLRSHELNCASLGFSIGRATLIFCMLSFSVKRQEHWECSGNLPPTAMCPRVKIWCACHTGQYALKQVWKVERNPILESARLETEGATPPVFSRRVHHPCTR